MVPKSKTNKVRKVSQKELLVCTLQQGGQSVFAMHSFPDPCIRALHFRNRREHHPSSTGLAVPLEPCPETGSSAPAIPYAPPVQAHLKWNVPTLCHWWGRQEQLQQKQMPPPIRQQRPQNEMGWGQGN